MSGRKMFITGGSGYIGSTLIEYALAEDYTITALSRTEESDVKITKLGATPVRGDFKSYDVLTREAAKADVVINIADVLAGSFGTITNEERFVQNNAAVDALVEGLKGSGKALLLTSGSLFAAPDPDGKETDETSPSWPENHPFFSDHEKRNLAYKNDNIRVCNIRLAPFVFGRGGSGVKLLMNMWAPRGAGLYIDEGKAHITTVHVDDAVRLYLLVAQKGRAGETYNATWETHITHRQLAEAICKQLAIPCNPLKHDVATKEMGPWFTALLASANRASNAKAKKEFGWEIKAEKGILDEIETGSYVAVAQALKKGDGQVVANAYQPRASE